MDLSGARRSSKSATSGTLSPKSTRTQRRARRRRTSPQFGMAGARPLAQAQELHAAIRGVRAAKAEAPTVAWADEFVGRQYYLGSAFQDVYVQPGPQVSLPSLSTELPFLRGFLARWGVKFEAVKRSSSRTPSTSSPRSPPHPTSRRRRTGCCAPLRGDECRRGRGARRERAPAAPGVCAKSTELTAAEATRARLLSGTRYADENADAVAKEAGTRAKLSLASYHRKIKLQKEKRAFRERVASAGAGPAALDEVAKALPALKDFTGGGSAAAPAADGAAADAAAPPPKAKKPAAKPVVALITAQGQIVRGNAPARARVVSAGAMRDALRAARKDNDVKAVVLRIDSPGGDAVASATIGARSALSRRGQAGGRVDGQRRRVGRVHDGGGGGEDRGAADDDHRLDWRARRPARSFRLPPAARAARWRRSLWAPSRGRCGGRSAVRSARASTRPSTRCTPTSSRRSPTARPLGAPREAAAKGRVDGPAGEAARPRRCARRYRRGRRNRVRCGRPLSRRRGPPVPAGADARQSLRVDGRGGGGGRRQQRRRRRRWQLASAAPSARLRRRRSRAPRARRRRGCRAPLALQPSRPRRGRERSASRGPPRTPRAGSARRHPPRR